MWDGSQKGENPSALGKNKIQWITDLPAGLRGRVIFGKGMRMTIKQAAMWLCQPGIVSMIHDPTTKKALSVAVKALTEPEHGTNLAEVGTDLISRAAAQTELQLSARRYTVAHEAHGEGRVVWSEDLISVSDAMDVLRKIPSTQPTFDARDTQYNLPIGTDCISRRAAINEIERAKVRIYHSIERAIGRSIIEILDDVEKDIRGLASAEPKRIKGKWVGADAQCGIACSVCGVAVDDFCHSVDYIDLDYEPNFCPNCGARMEVTT